MGSNPEFPGFVKEIREMPATLLLPEPSLLSDLKHTPAPGIA
jgi:hypothetical protein